MMEESEMEQVDEVWKSISMTFRGNFTTPTSLGRDIEERTWVITRFASAAGNVLVTLEPVSQVHVRGNWGGYQL